MKTVLQEFIEANNFGITGGSEYQWRCYGDRARYLDCDSEGEFSVTCIFDSTDQTVYEMQAWDYINDREYRWIHPDYKEAHDAEAVSKDIKPRESLDDRNYIDLELEEDMFEKIRGIRSGEEYDSRVKVPLVLEDDKLFELMKLAHEKDITLNQLVEDVLRVAVEKYSVHQTNTDNPIDFPVTKKKKKGK
jgi:hypothetical protein